MRLAFEPLEPHVATLIEECAPVHVTFRADANDKYESERAWMSFSILNPPDQIQIVLALRTFDTVRLRAYGIGTKSERVFIIAEKGNERALLMERGSIVDIQDIALLRQMAKTALIPWYKSAGSHSMWALVLFCVAFAACIPVILSWNNTLTFNGKIVAAACSLAFLLLAGVTLYMDHRTWKKRADKLQPALDMLVT